MTAAAASIYIDAARKLLPIVLVLFACNLFGESTLLSLQQEIAGIREQADAGNAIAQLLLGHAYERGDGVPQDDKEAVKWYRLAAAQELAKELLKKIEANKAAKE